MQNTGHTLMPSPKGIDGFLLSKAERIEKIAKAIEHLPRSSASIEHKLMWSLIRIRFWKPCTCLMTTCMSFRPAFRIMIAPFRSNFIGLDFSGRGLCNDGQSHDEPPGRIHFYHQAENRRLLSPFQPATVSWSAS